MNRLVRLAANGLLIAPLFAIGCKSGGDGDDKQATLATRFENESIPEGQPFAKLHYNMGMKEVSDLIGQPTDQDARATGKNWNPYYYGTDRYRTTWYYKGQGKLVFSSKGRLIERQYDPDASGYR